jgi:hypothetical protein
MHFNLYVVIALLISIFAGHFAVSWLLCLIRWFAGQPDKSRALDFWIGSTERTVATTLVIMAPAYVAAFIGAWIALKIAANWQRVPNKQETRQGTLIALLGNVYSFAFAIACGAWANPNALIVWNTIPKS